MTNKKKSNENVGIDILIMSSISMDQLFKTSDAIVDDIQNIQFDRPGRGKSSEQIKKHTLDSQYDDRPIEKSIYLLTSGDEIQKLSVIQSLPQMIKTDYNQTYSRVIPKILSDLPNSSCEFQVITSKTFKTIIEKPVINNLFVAILQGIESKDTIVSNSWMDTLIAVIPIVNDSQLKNSIVPLVHTKSQITQPLLSRIASCKMLGKICMHPYFHPDDIKKELVPLVQTLCQDSHPEVRAVMCSQLANVAQGLGNSLMKADLLTNLVELGSDDNMYVRSAAVSAIVHLFPYTTIDIKKVTLLPLFKQLCDRSLKSDDLTATTIAKEIGKILEGLDNILTVPECLWFLNFYKRLSIKGLSGDEFKGTDASMNVTTRQQTAVNLPAMATFVNTTIPSQMDCLYLTFKELAGDPCFIVRRTVAGCIHELIKIFNTNSKLLKSDFMRFLHDDSEEVINSLAPHLGTSLELFCEFNVLSRKNVNPSTLEIGRALLKCQYELASANNWRLITTFIHELEHLPNCMPSDFIHQHFTPILLTCAVEGRARPVRVQAVRTLLIYLRFNGKEMQKRWLRENLIIQLCRSNSCYTRIIYIKMCTAAMEIFSDKYFKEYFYESLLDLAADPVINIRLSVVNLFPSLKQMLTLPEDKLLNDKFNATLKRYSSDEKDKDVLETFQAKMKEIKNDEGYKEEYKKEQKRRREEEDRINFGSKPSVLFVPKKEGSRKESAKANSIEKFSSSELLSARMSSTRSLTNATKHSSTSIASTKRSAK